MPWNQSDLDALKAAISEGKGAKEITFSDQTVIFHSIEDMLKLLAAMQNDIQASGTAASSTRYAATSKGV